MDGIPEIEFEVKAEPIDSQVTQGLRKGYIGFGSIIAKIESGNDTEFSNLPIL